MKTHRFADLEVFLVAVCGHGARAPSSWTDADSADPQWSHSAFELVAHCGQAHPANIAILTEMVDGSGRIMVFQIESMADAARLALELYGAGAPFADVRCEVPIAHGRSGWSIDRDGSDYYEGDALPDHAHLYSDTERASMQRDLEIATFWKLGLPEGEIRSWQERRATA